MDNLGDTPQNRSDLFDPTQMRIKRDPVVVSNLISRIEGNALDLSPPFQRKPNIWTERDQSRLIESLLLLIPIPVFYFDAREENKWVVIDGVQRITAIARFVMDEKTLKDKLGSEISKLVLNDLEILTDLNNKTFDELEYLWQARIKETMFHSYIIESGTPENAKKNIFKRINAVSLPLHPQELRNAQHFGEATKLLADLAESDEFLKATNHRIENKRREDQEYVLRFITFTLWRDPDYEDGEDPDFAQFREDTRTGMNNLDQLLRNTMDYMNKMPFQKLEKLEEQFKRAMVAAHEIFGKDAFCKVDTGTYLNEIDPNLFEVWSVHLGQLSDDEKRQLIKKKEYLTNKYLHLLSDPDFYKAISPDPEGPRNRFEKVKEFIKEILNTPDPWENKYNVDTVVRGRIVRIFEFAAYVELEKGIEGVIPSSELSWTHQDQDPNQFFSVDDEVNVKVLKIIPKKHHITLSYKQTKPDPWKSVMEQYNVGSVVTGRIVKIVKDGAFVKLLEDDLVGLVPTSELSWAHRYQDSSQFFSKGDEINVVVRDIDPEKQRILLSHKQFVLNKYSVGAVVSGRIVGIFEFAAYVELEEGIDGLIPISELSWTKQYPNPKEFFSVGDKVDVAVLKIERKKRRIALSYKRTKPNPWEKYSVGDVVRGRIFSIIDFGAYVELEEGIVGLIHRAELSWAKQYPNPREFFSVGDEVNVVVRDIDFEGRRIRLSYKRTKPNPWENVSEKYSVGSVVQARIVKIVEDGALAKLEDDLEGVIPTSELSWTKQYPKPGEFFSKGDKVDVAVLKIERKKRRIALSYKRTKPNPWENVLEKYNVGSVVRGKIVSIADFGVFVELEEGIEGLIHISELSWTEARPQPRKFFSKGDEVDVMVLNIDREKRRIQLSYKQTKPEPWENVSEKYRVGSVVRGKIVSITDFGAFAKLTDGIEGLIHISELGPKQIQKPDEVVSIGDELDLKVINLDVKERRIGLSLKAMHNEQQHRRQRHPPRNKSDDHPTLLGDLLREELNQAASKKVNESPPTGQESEGGT